MFFLLSVTRRGPANFQPRDGGSSNNERSPG